MESNKTSERISTNTKEVHIEEALSRAGCGKYTYAAVVIAGLNVLASSWTFWVISFIVPATDCELHLTEQQKGTLTSMMITGMSATTHFLGFLADRKGRRAVAMQCNFASGFFSILAAFAPNFTWLCCFTFLNGAATAGVFVQAYVYIGESVSIKVRPISIVLTGSFGCIACIGLPVLAMFLIPLNFQWDFFSYMILRPWRLMLLVAVIPPFLSATLFCFLHESPKFLLSVGRKDEALEVLRCIYAANNGFSKDEFGVTSLCSDQDEAGNKPEKPQGAWAQIWVPISSLFRRPLLRYTVISFVLQAGSTGACNAIFMRLPQTTTHMTNFWYAFPNTSATLCEILRVQTNDHINFYNTESSSLLEECKVNIPVDTYYISAVTGIAQIISYCICGKLIQWFGCKKLLGAYVLLSMVLVSILNHVQNVWVSISIQAVVSLLMSSSLPVTVILIIGYFPTNIRSTASCLCLLGGRLASSVATQMMGLMQDNYCEASYYAVSTVLVGIFVVTLILPPVKAEEEPEISKA